MQMRHEYGDEVSVDYVDLSKPDKREEFKHIIEAVETYNWPYPLVAIEGELKMAGGINFAMIASHIDKIRKEARVEMVSGEQD